MGGADCHEPWLMFMDALYNNWGKFFLLSSVWEIIVYSRSTINAYSLFSHEWWVSLIKFMVGPIIHVREESTHLWHSGVLWEYLIIFPPVFSSNFQQVNGIILQTKMLGLRDSNFKWKNSKVIINFIFSLCFHL